MAAILFRPQCVKHTSMALRQSFDCFSAVDVFFKDGAREVTLKYIGK